MKSHDIVVMCSLLIFQKKRKDWSYRSLSQLVLLSLSETHASVKRLEESAIYDSMTKSIIQKNALELLVHGVKYMYPAKGGSVTRGVLTAHSAPIMQNMISSSDDNNYIWAYALGKSRGMSVKPLSKDVPKITEQNPEMYDILALVDCLRVGKVREKEIAENLLKELILSNDEY